MSPGPRAPSLLLTHGWNIMVSRIVGRLRRRRRDRRVRSMRILVVEDDRKIARAVNKGLEQEAFAVDTAGDYDEGLGLALTQEYDLLVLDRMLPGRMDAIDMCRDCLLYTSPSPRDGLLSRMPSS